MKKTTIYTTIIGIILISNIMLNAADYLSRAVVTSVEGKAEYTSSMQSGDVTKGIALPQSYTLKTGKDGTIDIILTSGVGIQILPGTILILDTLDIITKGLPDSNSEKPLKRVILNLRKGVILVNIPQSTKNIELTVKTKFGIVTANEPSIFEVSATSSAAEAKSGLGSFNVTSKNKKTTVLKGESVVMMLNEVQSLKNVSTTEILAFGTVSSEMLTSIFKDTSSDNTQDVIDTIETEIGATAQEPQVYVMPKPRASNQALPPEPIKNSDPSPSTL